MTILDPATEPGHPTLSDVEAASKKLAGVVRRTPLIKLDMSAFTDQEVYVKPESFQQVGSFKIRGAMNFVANLSDDVRARGVVAQSSGNHAQGVAAAAKHFGVKATIVIPEGAPETKVANTRALGAEVVRTPNTQADREGTAERIATETGATVVPPYDHPWIVAGQGTVGLEIVQDLPGVTNVIAPIGGGGLLSGVALAVKSLKSDAQVIGAEPELAADGHDSFKSGAVKMWGAELVTRTLADGARTQSIGELNLSLMLRYLTGVILVEEERLREGVRWYATKGRLVAEPTGTLSWGALTRLLESPGGLDGVTLAPGPTVIVLSGGNIDAPLLASLLAP